MTRRAALAAAFVIACEAPTTGGAAGADGTAARPDAAAAADAAPEEPVPEESVPTVVSAGGAVLAAPEVLPIVVANDVDSARIAPFFKALAASSWGEALRPYGVAGITVGEAVVLPALARSVDDADLRRILDDLAPRVAPGTGVLPVFLVPSGVTLTRAGRVACRSFGAYHDERRDGSGAAPYAVVARCAEGPAGDAAVTRLISHEIAESATNPLPSTAPAFDRLDDAHWILGSREGAEIADLCDAFAAPDVAVGAFAAAPFFRNRALPSADPCGGAPVAVAFPAQPDAVVVDDAFRGPVTTRGLVVPLGGERTLPIVVRGAAPGSTITVGVAPESPTVGVAVLLRAQEVPPSGRVRVPLRGVARGGTILALVVASGPRSIAWPALIETR